MQLPSAQKALQIALSLLLMIVSALSLAGFFSFADQVCELLSHLRIIWIISLLCLSLALLLAKSRKFSLVAFIVLAINAADVARLYLPDKSHQTTTPAASIKLLEMNVMGEHNNDYDAALKSVFATSPDIVCFSETTPTWLHELTLGLKEYQYRAVVEQPSDGLAIFSRIALTKVETKYSKAARRPRLYANLKIAQRPLTLEFAHPLLPINPYLRNEELDELAQDAKSAGLPFILAGDLNCTPWSYYFSKLLSEGKLYDTEQGYGPQPTWNSLWLLPVLPIDHCLTSAAFHTDSRQIGPSIGSDHLPVLVQLSF